MGTRAATGLAVGEEKTAVRWSDFSKDPNSPDALAWRTERVRQARARPIKDRDAYLVDLVRGKDVLDVGCVAHTTDAVSRGRWLHARLREAARSCLGVDVLPAEVEALQRRGFDVQLRDITRDPFTDRRFEVVVCGEVIEHVDSPAALFSASKQMLAASGTLVVTTPNPYYLPAVKAALLGGRFPMSTDHVALFVPSNMAELAERAGMRLERWRGARIRLRDTLGWWDATQVAVITPLCGSLIAAEALAHTLIYELRLAGSE